jgi:hypothetical protein
MSLIVELQNEIKSRHDIEGFMDRFSNTCLRAIDPGLNDLIFYKADMTGEKFGKPKYADGTPNPHWPTEDGKPVDPPRDKDDRKEFFDNVKQGHLTEWLSRVRNGEFDDNKVISAKVDSPVQDAVQDVTNLDMSMDAEEETKEEPVEDGVEIAKEKEPAPEPTKEEKKAEKVKAIVDESTPVDNSLVDLHNRPLEEQVSRLIGYNHEVGTPGALKMLGTLEQVHEHLKGKSHPVIRLREAIEEIARGTTDVDQDDTIIKMEKDLFHMKNDIIRLSRIQTEQQSAITTLKEKLVGALQKVPELIKAEILKKFSS